MAAWRRAIELSLGDEDTAKLNSIAQSRTEPANGSRHQPPGRDEAATNRRSTPSGVWVGYPVFSRPLVGTIVWNHTSVGRLPRAAFSALTRLGAM